MARASTCRGRPGGPARKKSVPDEVVDEGALFDSGRPVSSCRSFQRSGLKLDRVMVCWTAAAPPPRARRGRSLPFPAKSPAGRNCHESLRPSKSDENPGADLGQHLARHGLKVEVKRITSSPTSTYPSTILSYAADSSADMIVMGGYGIRAYANSCSAASPAASSRR